MFSRAAAGARLAAAAVFATARRHARLIPRLGQVPALAAGGWRCATSLALVRTACRPVGIHAKQGTDLHLAVPPMTSWGADTAYTARGSPARDRLGINPEESRHLSGSKQPITLAVHLMLLLIA